MEFRFADGETGPVDIARGDVYATIAEARRALRFLNERAHIEVHLTALGFGAGPVMSTNPLRFGEPNVASGLLGTSGMKGATRTKLLEMSGVILSNISVLMVVLRTLRGLGDYPRKLIGTYVVLELSNLYSCLKKLAKQEEGYRGEFEALQKALEALENDLGNRCLFRKKGPLRGLAEVRDKLVAHKDAGPSLSQKSELWKRICRKNIESYVGTFLEHLRRASRLFPIEARMYWMRRDQRMPPHALEIVMPPDNDYVRFEDDDGAVPESE